ncbi:ATP synthase subunit C lysine N-methyltransferase-like [Clupea harengus]|uniref:ATP synthase subunit C lysine N-methyltransferase-like n=1 Tax=Clupea harengus TaxID=7950 RepID=A0A8M1KSF9_CLUHA|nr:ATP synthase subunit C lysine N-methyltransferase-like [Clupea harengus]
MLNTQQLTTPEHPTTITNILNILNIQQPTQISHNSAILLHEPTTPSSPSNILIPRQHPHPPATSSSPSNSFIYQEQSSVPFLPSSEQQTQNVLKLLEGRAGLLADLGSGDGRLILGAHSMGFQCTGFEVNPVLLAYSRARVRRRAIPPTHIRFLNQDFWKTDLSKYQNVTVFLAPAVMGQLEQKLRSELPANARVVVCRFPLPDWQPSCSQGVGQEQVWAYDMPPQPCERNTTTAGDASQSQV